MNTEDTYRALANHLNSFPQGFPSTEDGVELELLANLFAPAEADFALHLSQSFTPLDTVTGGLDLLVEDPRSLVKAMTSKGLVSMKRGKEGVEVKLLPFIVGFYENQVNRMDETFARLFERYYSFVHQELFSCEPQFHRVVPVNETINTHIEILPEDNVMTLLSSKKAWAVLDCVCRKQKQLIGEGCEHPLRMCLAMSDFPNAFDGLTEMDALDLEGALAILDEASAAGLVHTVANQKGNISYICNCCTCSCGILRGIAETHIANVVARSAYVAKVDQDVCIVCGICEERCQFDAINIADTAEIMSERCVGCGVCAKACPELAITLHLRPSDEILPVPNSFEDWLDARQQARGLG
jgi:ferredoxin